jgi:protein-disulfide isomerase
MIRRALLLVLVAATAHAGGATPVGDGPEFDPQSVYKVPLGGSPVEGPADAPITIVDWSDYACGFCNRVQDTLDRLDRLYPGLIRWVHRALPLDDDNTVAAEAVRAAAAQGKFRPMHDRLYGLHGQVDRADVELLARELGLDMIRFRADLDAGTYRSTLARDLADAKSLGVSGTPMFFINGRPVHGAQPLRVFATIVDEELERARKLAADHPADLYAAAIAGGKLQADVATPPDEDERPLDPTKIYRVGFGMPGQQAGPDDAPVTVVEWSDFECPYCAKEAPVLAHLRAKYGKDLRVIYRHFPVLFHPDSMIAAEAAAAAAEQGKFWEFHDAVFAHFGHLSRADLESYASASGLDLVRFRAALDERRYHDAVVAEGAAAQALGVEGTPTFFINGQPIIGAAGEAFIDRVVQAHLDEARAAIARGLPARDVYPVVMSMASGEDRADPSAVPQSAQVEMRDDDRSRAVAAACRRHDAARAGKLAGQLGTAAKKRAANLCTGEGVDLP